MRWNKMRLLLIMMPLLFSSLHAQSGSSSKGTIVLEVTGFKMYQGNLMVSLNQSEAEYEADGERSFRNEVLHISGPKVELRFENIPYGDYAIKLYHDLNEDGGFDTNLLGMPQEAYGISNNVRGTFGLPDFEEAKFVLASKEKTISIQVE